jgi:hypothetical protein
MVLWSVEDESILLRNFLYFGNWSCNSQLELLISFFMDMPYASGSTVCIVILVGGYHSLVFIAWILIVEHFWFHALVGIVDTFLDGFRLILGASDWGCACYWFYLWLWRLKTSLGSLIYSLISHIGLIAFYAIFWAGCICLLSQLISWFFDVLSHLEHNIGIDASFSSHQPCYLISLLVDLLVLWCTNYL